MFGKDVNEMSGGDGLVLANMIMTHVTIDYRQDPPRFLSAVVNRVEAERVPDDVYDPDREVEEEDLLDLADMNNPELEGLFDFVEV
jgi:hypothetical protein